MFAIQTPKTLVAETCMPAVPAGLGEGTSSQCHLTQLFANVGSRVKLSFFKLSLTF